MREESRRETQGAKGRREHLERNSREMGRSLRIMRGIRRKVQRSPQLAGLMGGRKLKKEEVQLKKMQIWVRDSVG